MMKSPLKIKQVKLHHILRQLFYIHVACLLSGLAFDVEQLITVERLKTNQQV